jgi:hypothetical protein
MNRWATNCFVFLYFFVFSVGAYISASIIFATIGLGVVWMIHMLALDIRAVGVLCAFCDPPRRSKPIKR